MPKYRKTTILALILAIAAILRFYSLLHDSPYFFNPDERNMANAISQFRLPSNLLDITKCISSQFSIFNPQPTTHNPQPNCNLNPHFFSYGQFPLYLAFVTDQLTKPISGLFSPQLTTNNSQLTTSFSFSIFWLRFWSAITSVLTVLMVYLITKELFIGPKSQPPTTNHQLPTIAALITAFSPGLIQSAHFGTTESMLTFFFLASVYLSLRYLSDLSRLRFVVLNSVVIGLALGSKLTGIFFFIPPITALIIRFTEVLTKRGKNKFSKLFDYWKIGLLVFIGSILVFILSSPYNLVEPESFRSAVFGYESDVATGKYEAFYTRQFVNTTPIIFQAEKIFPYALGWPVFILGTLGFIFMSLQITLKFIFSILVKIKNLKFKNQNYNLKLKILNFDLSFFILIFAFLIYLFPNSFLFAKWTRFMTPILPFFSIFTIYLLSLINKKSNHSLVNWIIGLLIITSILPGLMFMSIYTHEDSRVTASKWIYQNIPNNSYVLSETANVVDIPLGLPQPTTHNPQLTTISFDLYHLDENPQLLKQLLNHLEKADYIFIPSRRIFANYTKIPHKYPLVTKYYQLLFSGALGFEKVSEISSFPQLSINNYQFTIPDENSEETSTVFDHPVIRIYRKIKPMTIDDYRYLFSRSMSLLRSFESLS